MNKKLIKGLALTTVIVMSLNFFAPIIYGVEAIQEGNLIETEENQNTNEENLTIDDETIEDMQEQEKETEEAVVVGEIEEKRKLNEKHFLLDDGTMMVAVYPDNVHYEENGELKDIDNTLKSTRNKETEEVYQNTKNSFKVNFMKKASDDKLVSIIKDGFEIKWSMQDISNKENLSEEDVEYENELQVETDIIENSDSARNKLEEFFIKENEETKIDTKGKINETEAKILKKEDNKIKNENVNEERINLKNVSSSMIYENILNDIDLQYDVKATSVKESIIIKNEKAIEDQFIFKFNTGKLIAELTEDKEVIIYNEERENIIYTINTPYMFDSNFEYSQDIEVTLEEVKEDENNEDNKEYILTIIPSKEWLTDEGRVYPVMIDPTVETSNMRSKIQDEIIYNGDWDNWGKWNSHIMRIGNTNDPDPTLTARGRHPFRQMIKFTLPELASGDQIIEANLYLATYPLATSYTETSWTPRNGSIQIDVHKVTQDWWEGNAWWNNLKDAYNTKIEDYSMYQFDYNNQIHQNAFNITSIVKEWYTTGNNYGLMLKEHTEQSNFSGMDARFFSSDVLDIWADCRPSVTIIYRNQTGLENYLDYHTQSVGRAGTVYTNDYNGNLVLIHEDLSTPGDRMPVTISHVYNTNYKNSDTVNGRGMRLNLSQLVSLITIGTIEYARYTDEDGTIHYFPKQAGTNTYKDEDGLGLTLTLENNEFKMKDKSGNTSKFMVNPNNSNSWHLKQIEDTNGNKIILTLSYNTYNSFIITKVTDGAGDEITLTYQNDRLKTMTDKAGRTITYQYDVNSNLTSITYPDNKQSVYTYSNNLLTSVKSIDNARIDYEYYPEVTSRVKSIKEYSTSNELGNTLSITYGSNLTKFTDNKGYSNIYTFNNWGQATSIADFGKEENNIDNAYGKSYKYGTTSANKNKLTLEGKLTSVKDMPNNLLKNPTFDSGTTSWTGYNLTSSDKVETVNGNNAFKIVGSATASKNLGQEVAISGKKGDVYSFYGWAKSRGVPNADNEELADNIKVGAFFIRLYAANGETQGVMVKINPDTNRMAVCVR